MKVGLIDVDSHKYPNLVLMKVASYHKSIGDHVEWYSPLFDDFDLVYQSKVFTFTPDYPYKPKGRLIKGGSGYGLEGELPPHIEHIYPDYSIYGDLTHETAYGFLTRGCPRGCPFCIVGEKEGRISRKVANLSEFWKGEKFIEILDPNILACEEWEDLFSQLEESGAYINFNQGLDIRLMTKEKAEALERLKIKMIHFAWDNYEFFTYEKLKEFKEWTNIRGRNLRVYVLVNFNTTIEQDLERIYKLRELGYDPYVMRYDRGSLKRGHILNALARWVNNKYVWRRCERFEDYTQKKRGS